MTRTVLVTGAAGFIGRNLCLALGRRQDVDVIEFDIGSPSRELEEHIARADVIFHLAGVNRPKDAGEFEEGNANLTRRICTAMAACKSNPTLVVSSSTQATTDTDYGRSKKAAEDAALELADTGKAKVHVFRLPNVFGKWCRPNYNSVVATFCHNLARGLPVRIDDPKKVLQLVHVDDVVRAFLAILEGTEPSLDGLFARVEPVHTIALGELEKMLRGFAAARETLLLPDMAKPLTRAMYSTYVSYLPEDELAFALKKHEDPRGALAEVLKSPHAGQLFFSTTRPGVTRGNHCHDRKVEKFIVVSGEAVIRLEHMATSARIDVPVSGSEMKVVDIPPGYTHNIQNVGGTDLVVLFWANEVFDEKAPDTYFKEVSLG